MRLSAHDCAGIKWGLVIQVTESSCDISLSLTPPSFTVALCQNSFPSLNHYDLRDMSRAAKLTLAGTSLGAIGIVVLVHYQQNAEKAVSLPSFYNGLSMVTALIDGLHFTGNACWGDTRY